MKVRSSVDLPSPYDKIQRPEPTLSFEFFPPKTPDGWSALETTLQEVAQQLPDFVSVTYGAGGSTRQKTVSLVGQIQNDLGIETMAHLTCVGHSREELKEILEKIKTSNVRAIMALRGDPPSDQNRFVAHEGGFAHGSDLIRFIKDHFDFVVGCACYPETHMEAADTEADLGYLKLKQDLGADFTVTQLFFDNTDFYRFRQRAQKAGVTIPIVAGIMPVTGLKQLDRFQKMCGCRIPAGLRKTLENASEETVVARGIEYGTTQCGDLLKNEVAGLHLYTLNKSVSSTAITENLRSQGVFGKPSN